MVRCGTRKRVGPDSTAPGTGVEFTALEEESVARSATPKRKAAQAERI